MCERMTRKIMCIRLTVNGERVYSLVVLCVDFADFVDVGWLSCSAVLCLCSTTGWLDCSVRTRQYVNTCRHMYIAAYIALLRMA